MTQRTTKKKKRGMGIDGEFLKKKSLQMEFARTGKVGRQTLL